MDARLLIITFALTIIVTLAIPTTNGLLVLSLYLACVYRFAGEPLARLITRLRPIVPFVPLIIIVNALFVGSEPLPSPFGWLHREGFGSGIYYSCRLLALYLAMLVILAHLSPERFAGGIAGLLRPISKRVALRVALYGFLVLGFVPMFADEIERIRTAQRFRGGDIGGGLVRRVVASRLLLVPLIMSAIHRSGQLAMVVEVRGVRSAIAVFVPDGAPRAGDFVLPVVTIAILLLANLIR